MTYINGPIRHHTRDCDPFAQEWNRIMDQLDHDRFEPQPNRWTDPAPVEPQEIEETVGYNDSVSCSEEMESHEIVTQLEIMDNLYGNHRHGV